MTEFYFKIFIKCCPQKENLNAEKYFWYTSSIFSETPCRFKHWTSNENCVTECLLSWFSMILIIYEKLYLWRTYIYGNCVYCFFHESNIIFMYVIWHWCYDHENRASNTLCAVVNCMWWDYIHIIQRKQLQLAFILWTAVSWACNVGLHSSSFCSNHMTFEGQVFSNVTQCCWIEVHCCIITFG